MGNTCVGNGCCNPNSRGSGTRKPMDKPFSDPSPGKDLEHTFFAIFKNLNYLRNQEIFKDSKTAFYYESWLKLVFFK